MMKSQNEILDEEIQQTAESENSSKAREGFVRLEGERSYVPVDDKTIYDDIGDYVFSKGRRKKKESHHSEHNPDDDFNIVRSNRSSSIHKKKRKRKKMKLWKKILISVVCVILALIVLIIGTSAYLLYKGSQEMFEPDVVITAPENINVQEDGEYVYYMGKTYEYNENITSMLFMGVDTRTLDEESEHGTSGQADVLVLMAIDTKTGKITMMNISRDTMIDVAIYSANGGYVGTEVQQICLSYAYGDGKETSCENTVSSVRKLFYNVPVKSYLALNLDGIAAVNDSVGGVDVVSPETIGNFVEGESYHLEGKSAESFIRSRRHDTPDANTLRMKRQQIYAQAFMNKIISATKQNISTPIDLFNSSAPYTCTNLNPSKIAYLAEMAVTSENFSTEMITIPGQSKLNGVNAEFNIDEKAFYEMFLDVYYNEVTN